MNIGGFLGDLFHNIGNLIGIGNHPQQPQQPQHSNPVPVPSPMGMPAPVQRPPQMAPTPQPIVAPQNHISALPNAQHNPGATLQKAPAPAPAPTATPQSHVIAPPTIMPGTLAHPDFSASAVAGSMQAQRHHDAAVAAAPAGPEPAPVKWVTDRLGHSFDNTIDQINNPLSPQSLSSGNAVGNFAGNIAASIPQNLVKAGVQVANQFGANVGTHITDPTVKRLLNEPDGNIGNLTKGGNDAAASIDSVTGDGKGNGLQKLPDGAKTALGGFDAGMNLIPGLGLIKGLPGTLIKAGSRALSKVGDLIRGGDEAAIAARDAKVASEVAPGVHSVNPNPKPVEPPVEPAPITADGQPVESPSQPGQTTASSPIEAPPEPVQGPVNQSMETTEPPVQSATMPQTPIESQTPPPPSTPETPSNPSSLSSPSDNNVPQGATNVKPGAKTAPNSPDFMTAVNKEIESNNAGNTHEVMNKQQMAETANQRAQSADLLTQITSHTAGAPVVHTPQDAMDAVALMRRMYAEAKDDPQAKVARDNLANAVAEFGSKAGQETNIMADVTAGLPSDARANILTKTIGKMWGPDVESNANAPTILKTLSGQTHVQNTITDMLDRSQALDNEEAALKGQIEELGKDPANIGKMHELGSQLRDVQLSQLLHNGETRAFVAGLAPKASGFERVANGARTNMLLSVGGRVKNVVNVGSNTLYEHATALLQAGLGRALNLFLKDGNKAIDSTLVNRSLATGTKQGFKQAGAELGGKVLSNQPLTKVLTKAKTDAYGLTKANANKGVGAKITNFTHGLVNAPKNLFGQGVKDAQITRLARQEGLQQGLKGDELHAYTVMRSYVPSKEMAAQGQELMDQVSHTNHNWIADKLGSWLEGDKLTKGWQKGVAGILRNGVLPFAKYPATFLYNTLSDRNIIADAAHLAVAATRGDVNGITKALARSGVDGTLMYTGYHLLNSGVITPQDGNGYSDGGMYIHIGNRYIPLGLLGVTAESLLGGAAIAKSAQEGGDLLGSFAKTVGNTLLDTLKLGGAQTFIGADNTALTTAQDALANKGNVNGYDALAAGAAATAGQFIPGPSSDANAVLNHTALNPTGEQADTKITKGDLGGLTATGKVSTAKDIPASSVMSFANRIPVLSQTLPRKSGTTANDMIDRVTGGTHVGQAQQNAADAITTAKDSLQTQIQHGIPVYTDAATKLAPGTKLPDGYNFDDTVEKQVESGNYDNAVKGLQSKLDALNKEGKPQTKTQPVQDQIKQLGVLKDQGLSPDFRKTYSGTTLTEWRKMGDPTSDSYDPATYQKLWNYDQSLAKAGVAGSGTGGDGISAGHSTTQKYSAKSTSASASASKAATLIKDNKVGSLPTLQREDFTTNLGAKEIATPQRQVKLTAPGGLIKARNISVSSRP